MAESKTLKKKNDIDIYQRVLSQRSALRNQYGSQFLSPAADNIKKVIVILGSSRSGSSLLYHLLSQHPDLLSLQGEEVTFTKMFGLNKVAGFEDSDELNPSIEFDARALVDEMLSESGFPARESSRLALDRAQRILLQWPELDFNLEKLMNACKAERFEDTLSQLNLSSDLYDDFLKSSARERSFFIEEPPFVIPQPKQYGGQRECTLLLKSSVNAFRPGFLQKLFPKAEFHYIHLTRHPASAINGLIDGWLSPAFQTHNLSHFTALFIEGYSNQHWWKFDLPPGWKNYTSSTLEEVCAFQWRSSNENIIEFLKNKPSSRVRYEELMSEVELKKTLSRLTSELKLSSSFLDTLEKPRLVMSVNTPQKDRWKTRADIILPLVRKPEIASLAVKLGYEI